MKTELWKRLSKERAQCRLCSRFCVVSPGRRGFCGVRENVDGELRSLVASGLAALNLDPVEKKPLYHYLPGTQTLSFGAPGCNFACVFCQNSQLSHEPRERGIIRTQRAEPEELVREAKRLKAASISFTYSEPTVFFELAAATADIALEAGLGTVLVSNGFQSPQSLEALGPRIRAANIDLKSFRDEFYRRCCGARLAPVLAALRRMRELGWWVEVTTLLIPGLNDTAEEAHDIAHFIARELGPDTPWHISRFHPAFHMSATPPTPLAALERAALTGKEEGLRFVYVGNAPGNAYASTLCPACGRELLGRRGYLTSGLPFDGTCGCGARVPGVWSGI